VSVRELHDHDAPALFELLADPIVAADMSPPPPSIEAFRGFIAWARSERQAARSIAFGIVPNGLQLAVGVIQLRPQEPSWGVAEWGFAIGASFWGTGAFPEAASLVAGFAFDRMSVHRLEARAVAGNTRGNGALQKLGAQPEGTLASAFNRGDHFDAQLLWAVNADEWRQRPAVGKRFSLADACERIAEAVREVEERAARRPPSVSTGVPAPHPFFIRSDEGRNA
jgi:RimJ/RimL family protein N-acetyltransferase